MAKLYWDTIKNKFQKNLSGEAILRLAGLLGLCIWLFWPNLSKIAGFAAVSSEAAHAVLAPIFIILLIYLRRNEFTKNLSNGSWHGITIILAGLILYAITIWPFSYGYINDLSIVPVLAGIILVTCGSRVLKLSFPILLLVALSIPIGARIYARLIIPFETYTIGIIAELLNLIPGVRAFVEGLDIFCYAKNTSEVIALGESNRGAKLFMAIAMIGIFVIFSRKRTARRLILAIAAAVPVLLFCNFLRFLVWSLITVFFAVPVGNPIPRNISAFFVLIAAYCVFMVVSEINLNLFVEAEETL